MPVLTVKNGAHHADALLPYDDDDTVRPGSNLKQIRSEIETYLNKWINKYDQTNQLPSN